MQGQVSANALTLGPAPFLTLTFAVAAIQMGKFIPLGPETQIGGGADPISPF